VDGAGKVVQRHLTLDRTIGDQWLVTAGVAPGDRVIVEGIQKARPGDSVKAVPFEAGRKAGVEPKKTTPPAAKSN
jgi:membrane fusion protein (multidrug efflux system)